MTDPDTPIRSDDDLVALLDRLIGQAVVTRAWLVPIADARVLAFVQLDGMPVDPDPEEIAEFADRLRDLVRMTSADSVAIVWERPGGPDLRMQEADWVAGVAACAAPVRAQLLSSDAGVRLLDPTFEALVA